MVKHRPNKRAFRAGIAFGGALLFAVAGCTEEQVNDSGAPLDGGNTGQGANDSLGGQGPTGGSGGQGPTGGSGGLVARCEVATATPSAVQAPVLRQSFAGSWDENWYGSPAVFDLDQDGDYEIIAGRHSVLYVHDAAGTLLWRAAWGQDGVQQEVHGSSRTYPSVAVGDLDGDGDGEIVGVSSNNVYVYDHTGTVIRQWDFSQSELRSVAVADVDGSLPLEILVVTIAGSQVSAVIDYDGGIRSGWPTGGNCGGFNQNIGAGNLVGDGALEIVSTFDCCYFSVHQQDGTPVPVHSSYAGSSFGDVPLFHDLSLAQQGWGPDGEDRDELTDSPPVIVDLDQDGQNEIVLVADHERAGEYVNRGNSFWVFENDMQRSAGWKTPKTTGMPLFTGYSDNIVQVAPAVSVADFAPNAGLELVAPSYDGKLYAFAADGTALFSYTFDDGSGPFIGASEALIVDLNGDGIPEILFNTYSTQQGASHMVILDAQGQLLHAVPLSGRGNMAPPTVFDIDQDGDLEIVQSLKDAVGGGSGGMQVWDVPGSYDNCRLWPTGRANFLRNGAPPYD